MLPQGRGDFERLGYGAVALGRLLAKQLGICGIKALRGRPLLRQHEKVPCHQEGPKDEN